MKFVKRTAVAAPSLMDLLAVRATIIYDLPQLDHLAVCNDPLYVRVGLAQRPLQRRLQLKSKPVCAM